MTDATNQPGPVPSSLAVQSARTPGKIGIGLIAPAGFASDEAALERGLTRLAAMGCQVSLHTDQSERCERFGATDAQRLAHLHAVMRDPAVDIVLSTRGGYGISRLLPFIDWQLVAESGKLLVGHSDLTAFQMGLLAHTGSISFAGPMLTDDFGRAQLSDFTMQHFWQCLGTGRTMLHGAGGAPIAAPVKGVLWGGNLAMMTHLIGTPYLPKIVGGILFLEDINEHPFRVERMLLQLLHAGVLAQQSAIILGDFSGGRLVDFDNGYSMDSVITLLRSRIDIPIVTGLQFGHIADKVTLPVGANACLRSSAGGWELEISGYPFLNRPLPAEHVKGADTRAS